MNQIKKILILALGIGIFYNIYFYYSANQSSDTKSIKDPIEESTQKVNVQDNFIESTTKDISGSFYKGGWPYNENKDNMFNPEFRDCSSIPYGNGCECVADSQCREGSTCENLYTSSNCVPQIGVKIPRFIAIDQFGDYFDLYDLSNKGLPILISVGAQWSDADHKLFAWLSSNDLEIKKKKWWNDDYQEIKNLIDNNKVFFVHIMHQDFNKEVISASDITYWHDAYPHNNIIFLADPESKMKNWIRPTGYPCFILLNEDLTIQSRTMRGMDIPFRALLNYYSLLKN